MEAWRQRAFRFMDRLQDSQMTLATGQTFLYKVEKEWVQRGKGGYWSRKKPVIVEDPEEIRDFIEREGDGSNPKEDDDGGDIFYYMTVKEPSNQAIDSIIDRAGGKAIATTQIQGADGGPLQVQVVKYDPDTNTV